MAGEPRRYRELCPIALALDVIGDRWTLLLIRELFAGPKRFTDLEQGLPGVGSSVLATRLRHLEQHGLVRRRRLPRPAPALIYELTPRGASLDAVVLSIARWGAAYLPGQQDLVSRGRWLLQALAATADPPPPGLGSTNFVLDGEESHIRVGHRRLAARDGLLTDARATVRGTVPDLYTLATTSGTGEPGLGRVAVDGDRRAAEWLLKHLVAGLRSAANSGTSTKEHA